MRRDRGAARLSPLMFLARQTSSRRFSIAAASCFCSFATALAVAALAHPASQLGPIVGCKPMRWIGERSYGIYLWTLPDHHPHHAGGRARLLGLLRGVASGGRHDRSREPSHGSYLENPIRHGALGRAGSGAAVRTEAGASAPAGVPRRAALVSSSRRRRGSDRGLVRCRRLGSGVQAGPGRDHVGRDRDRRRHGETRSHSRPPAKSVVHIGDSTSEGLVSATYLPDEKKLIGSQYARDGAKTRHLEVSGARSIYEHFEGLPNAQEVAEAWQHEGF